MPFSDFRAQVWLSKLSTLNLHFAHEIIIIIIIFIVSFAAKIGNEKHDGDEMNDKNLADRLLLLFKSSWEVHRNK